MKAAWRARWPWIAALLVTLWALAWFGAPPLVKSQIEKRGTQALGRELRIDSIELTPRLLALTLGGVRIAAAPGAAADAEQPLLQVERLHLDMHMRSLWRLAPVLEAVEVSAPKLRLARLADGRYDIDDLIQRFKAPEASADAEPARFALFNLQLRDGEIVFDDRPVDRTHRLGGIRLDLPFLSNLSDDLEITVEPRLAFVVDGSAIDIGGTTTPFADGRRSAFQLRLDHFPLEAWWAYWPRELPVRGRGGALDAALTLNFEQRGDGAPRVALQGRVDIHDLALRGLDEEELLRWRKLSVTLDEVRPLERQVALQTVRLEGARLKLRRDAAGALNIAKLIPGEEVARGGSVNSAASPDVAASSAAAAGQGTPPALKFSLGRLEFDDARIDFADASTRPATELALDVIELSLADLKWPVEGDATLALRSRVVRADVPVGDVLAQGALSDRHAKIDVQLQDLQLASAGPYLRQWLRPPLSGTASADAHIDWAVGDEPRQTVVVSALRLADLALGELPAAPSSPKARSTKSTGTAKEGPVAALAALEIKDLRADLLQRQVTVGQLRLQRPELGLDRDADGKLNVEEWFTAAPAGDAGAEASQTIPQSPQPAWRAELTALQIDAGRVRFKDALGAAQGFELSALQAGVEGLAWPLVDGGPALRTRFAAKLAPSRRPDSARAAGDEQPATVQWAGQVTLAPASTSPSMVTAAKGQLRVERLAVQTFEAYFEKRLPLTLQRAEAGFRGTVDLRQSGPSIVGEVRGDALLADVRVAMRDDSPSASSAVATPAPDRASALADPAQLLSWNAMSLDGLSVLLRADAKPRVEIAELRLTDYFARLEITEQGRLNLQNVAPANAANTAGTPNTPAPSASAARGEAGVRLRGQPIDLVLGSAQLSNGRVAFEDRFVRPNYRAQLSELNGRIGRFDSSTREMATLKFDGRVAGTGVLAIEGAVNPSVDPPALDIRAKATDIELPGLTPYASKYAGYPIERGKLSIDVAYKIDEQGKLEARNQIIVNQLTLGPKSDSPDATSLPVRLAVALLQDRNGVIDIDLPLSGSIDDPQFSLGGLILKAIVNLLTKVVTAPFSLLGGSGDGKDLSRIEFEPGSATVADGARPAIDKVAQALADRPALNVSVSGQADARSEAPAMQRAALEQRLRDEQRLERARASLGSSADTNAPLPPLSAAQRALIVERLYAQLSPASASTAAVPASGAASAVAASASAAAPKALTVAEMETRLAEAVTIDEAAARALAVQRASAVRDALIAKGLSRERLFLAEPGSAAKAADNEPRGPSAQLTLAPR